MNYNTPFSMEAVEIKQDREEQEDPEIVEDMLTTIQRLQVHAENINVIVEEDVDRMDDIDTEIDIAQSRMERTSEKMDQLLNTNEKKYSLIIFLMIVLAVLLYFVFS
eukprot:156559_1